MGVKKIQVSFTGGELSPSMYGRFDDKMYQQGLARCRNFIVLPQGPVVTRPGTAYVNAAKYPDQKCRLIPFTFSADQTIVIEVGGGYMRFHTNGKTVLATNGRPYEISTPYRAEDVKDIHYVQSMDVMTLVHPYYPPKELRRYGDTDWRLVDIKFGAPLPAPGAPSVSYTVVAGKDVEITSEERTRYDLKYKVTALKTDGTGTQEGPASGVGQCKGNLYLNNATCTITWSPVTGANRYRVYKNYRGLYCYIGETDELSFVDDNYEPDASITPPVYESPFVAGYGVSSVTLSSGGSGYQGISMDDAAAKIYQAFVDSEGEYKVNRDNSFYEDSGKPGGLLSKEDNYMVFSKKRGEAFVTMRCSYAGPGAVKVKYPSGSVIGPGDTGSYLDYRYFDESGVTLENWEPQNYYEIVDVEGSGASFLLVFERSASRVQDASSKLTYDGGLTGNCAITVRLKKVLATSGGQGYVAPRFCIRGTRIKFSFCVHYRGMERYLFAKAHTITRKSTFEGAFDFAKFFPAEVDLSVVTPPHAYIVDAGQTGVGAELGVSVGKGRITGITVRASGSGYSSPQVVILGGGGGGASARANVGSTGDYPGAVCYFEQRRCFAGTPTRPQMVWMTRSGTESDMSYTLPSRDDNRMRFAIASQEASRIRHLMPLLQILALTDTTEYRVYSGGSSPISPSAIKSEVQAQIGASNVQPVVVNSTVVYAASRGGHLHELGYSLQASGFTTADLSVRSAHFFEDNRVVDLALSKAPNPIVWAATTNGELLGLTYLPEQGIGGWHKHDLSGSVESVTVVPEGDEDILYLVVRRTVNGQTVRYIERMHEFYFKGLENTWQVDCAGVYLGTATSRVSGLTWLEGETVSILADGAVTARQVVKDGTVTLEQPAQKVVVGLPITAEIETLPVAVQMDDGSYGVGHMKNVGDVWIRVVDSSGTFIGPDFDNLTEVKQRTFEPYSEPPKLAERELSVMTESQWNDSGQICIRQVDPLPLKVVAVAYELAS